jgi:hypothetical protein
MNRCVPDFTAKLVQLRDWIFGVYNQASGGKSILIERRGK